MSADAIRVRDGFDSLLIVHNPDGSELAMNDDIENGIQTNSLIENLVLSEDGTYEIEVRSGGDLSGGSYTLMIESDRVGTTATPTLTATP